VNGASFSYSRGPGFRQCVGSETTVLTYVLPKSAQSDSGILLPQMRPRPSVVALFSETLHTNHATVQR